MTVLKYIFIGLEVVLLFNLLIGVHELGHFLAAKWRGLKIERFAIWFGKPIWKKKINGVEYVLGWIPAGGYVALPQMATMILSSGETFGSASILVSFKSPPTRSAKGSTGFSSVPLLPSMISMLAICGKAT